MKVFLYHISWKNSYLIQLFFKAIAGFFPIITPRVKDRFGAIYSVDNYYEFTEVIGQRIKPIKIEQPTNAYKPIVEHLEESLKQEFSL